MPIISNGEIVEDSWILADDEIPLTSGSDVVLPLARLKADADVAARHNGRLGVVLPNDAKLEDIADLLPRLALVVLEFPAFTDGRAYSQARRLRTQYGFTGEIRASGNVLADQAAFMTRVGFDSFDVAEGQPLETWRDALEAMTRTYQQGYRGGATRYGNRSEPAAGASA